MLTWLVPSKIFICQLNEDTKIRVRTSVGDTDWHNIEDGIGQGAPAAALVSSCSIGNAIHETFKDKPSTKIGNMNMSAMVFQDDIAKMNDELKHAREGCEEINETLLKKLLSVNYDKSKFVIIGNKAYKDKIMKELEKNPMMMGKVKIDRSVMEKYLGDLIHEKGCEASILETIKERLKKLRPKMNEIIQTSENPMMQGLSNAEVPFKLFESTVITPLLNNCESWIGIKDQQLNLLQKFQEEFIEKVLRISNKTTKAIINWDVGLPPMKWRIGERKLQFLRKTMAKDYKNITKRALFQEVITDTEGLVHECRLLGNEIGIPDLMFNNSTKSQIKSKVKEHVKREYRNAMENQKKVQDRLTDNPEDNSYLKILPLPLARVWFRYRARATANVKGNFRHSHTDMSCDLCTSNEEMNQEHLETCEGTGYERRGLNMRNWKGILDFWRRMTIKLQNSNKPKPKLAAVTDEVRQQRDLHDT